MNKSFLPHLVWAFVAVTAFLLGAKLTRDQDSSSSGAPLSSRVNSNNSDSPEGSGSSRSNDSRDSRNRPSSATASLTEADILALGQEFRFAKGPLARRLAFTKILEALTPENAIQLRQQIVHLEQDSPEFREFHYAWGSLAGETAVMHGEDTPKRDMSATLAGWMSSNPDAAMAWFDSLSDDDKSDQNHLKWGAVYGLADNDPTRAAEFATARFENGDRDARRMVNIALDALLRTGDTSNLDAFTNAIPEGPLTNTAYQHIAKVQAEQDPVSASEWARTLPDGDGKNHAVGTSFHMWADRDPEAAAAQIATLSGAEKDAATFGYATRVVRDDPATGVEWAAQISDQEARQKALIETGRVYFRRDRDAAREWLASSGLSEEQQQQVTRRGRRRGRR